MRIPNNQTPRYNNQIITKWQLLKRFGYWLLKIGICLYLVSWLLVISPLLAQAPVAEEKVTLHFKGVEIKDALLQLAKEAKINIVGEEEVEGRITLSLKDVPIFDALSAILKGSGYTYEMTDKNILRIVPAATPPKRILLGRGLYVQTFSIDYANPESVKETISPLLPKETQILVLKDTSKLLIRGSLYVLKTARELIRALDLPPKQVMVEARIMEITHTTSNTMGMNIGWTNPKDSKDYAKATGLASEATATGAKGLYLSVSSQNIEALAESYRSRTGYNLLSSPRVMAIDGQSAEIMTGSRLGYKTKTVTTTGLIESIEFMDVGTKLTIKPRIKDDGTILMEVHPEVSTGSIVNELPQKDSTETTTTLAVKDGQTIIIGGLLRDYVQDVVQGVPLLMEVPFLGTLFRRTVTDTQKREMIVLISPHLVNVEEIARGAREIEALEKARQKATEYSPIQLFR